MYKKFNIIIFFTVLMLTASHSLGAGFIENDTKFQQYNQPVAKEPIDYFNLSPYFYHPSLFMPYPVYSPYTYQYLDERERINNMRDDNTLTDPETYNINRNDRK